MDTAEANIPNIRKFAKFNVKVIHKSSVNENICCEYSFQAYLSSTFFLVLISSSNIALMQLESFKH